MAIAVGELLVAINGDASPLKQALAEVDRLSKGYADRSVSYQKAVNEARKDNTAAQRVLNAEQKKYNALAEKAKQAKQEGKKLAAAEFQQLRQASERLEKARTSAAGTSSRLNAAVQLRDDNKLEMARALQRVKAARVVDKAEKDAAKERKAENKLTENEYVGKKKMRAAANRDIDKQRKAALKEEREAERRIEAERERYRKLERNQRRSAINNHIAELQRREAHEIEADKRVHGERERLRKRELAARKVAFAQLLDEKFGPVSQRQQQTPALPPGMRLRNGQLVPIRQAVQGPALPPGMRLSGGRLAPIVTPLRPPRPPRPPRSPAGKRPAGLTAPGLDTFGITSTLIATAGVAELARTANEMQVIQQRLAQVSQSGGEAALAFNKLAEGAQRLRQPLGETAELYTKLRQSNQNVGMSANQTLKVTEAFSAALRISGATGQTAASALLQFGQAMAKGKLDGDEFRTVAENASEVLRVLERQTGMSRGELLKMREEGKLTAKMMADSLIKEYDNLIDRATKLAPSLAQGATTLRNSLLIAMTNTRSAREAIEKLALKMVGLADFISENGPMISNMVILSGKLFALKKGFDLLRGAMDLWAGRAVWMASSAGPIGLTIAALGALLTITQLLRAEEEKRRRGLEEEIENAGSWAQANNLVARYTKEAAKAQAALNKQLQNPMAESGLLKEQTDVLRKRLAEKMALLKQAGEAVNARRDMAVGPVVTAGDSEEDKKANKGKAVDPEKELDNEIDKLLELYEAELLTADGLARLTAIRDQAQSVVNNLGDATSRTAAEDDKLLAANRRLVAIKEVLNPLVELENEDLKEQASLVDTLNDNYDNLSKTLQKIADDLTRKQLKDTVGELHETQKAFMTAIAQLDAKSAQGLLQKIAELQAEIATLQQKLAERDSEGMGTGGKPTKGDKKLVGEEMLDRFIRRTKQGLLSLGLETPGKMVETLFTSMAEAAQEGGIKVSDKMKEAFAKISMKGGTKLIDLGFAMLAKQYGDSFKKMIGKMIGAMAGPTTFLGKFMTKIKLALSNPLIAGPALIAVGVAMAAYAAKMGAIGRGEGGGDIGATIGSLGVGGQDKTLRYTFADRRNPLEGNRVVGMPQQAITVNQTIIGANDPVAQRQIGDLVNNAARRGIIRSNG